MAAITKLLPPSLPAPLKHSPSRLIQAERLANEWGHVKCVHPFTKGFGDARTAEGPLQLIKYGLLRPRSSSTPPVPCAWTVGGLVSESIAPIQSPWKSSFSIHQDRWRCMRLQSVYVQLLLCTPCHSVKFYELSLLRFSAEI